MPRKQRKSVVVKAGSMEPGARDLARLEAATLQGRKDPVALEGPVGGWGEMLKIAAAAGAEMAAGGRDPIRRGALDLQDPGGQAFAARRSGLRAHQFPGQGEGDVPIDAIDLGHAIATRAEL